MRYRSMNRSATPKAESPYRMPMSYSPKSLNISRSIHRSILKQYYKSKRKEDQQIGLRINELFQCLHEEYKKEAKDRDTEVIKSSIEQISSLRKERLFKEDFPSLSAFRRYLKKEKVSLKDLLSLE